MGEKRILVIGGGARSAALAAALVAAGGSVDGYMQITARPDMGVSPTGVLKPGQNAYGPARKGRGGKPRRW